MRKGAPRCHDAVAALLAHTVAGVQGKGLQWAQARHLLLGFTGNCRIWKFVANVWMRVVRRVMVVVVVSLPGYTVRSLGVLEGTPVGLQVGRVLLV